MRSTCAKCGKQLPERSGPGHPTVYCPGATCRRAAEFEIRRAQRAIEAAERRERDCELELTIDAFYSDHLRERCQRERAWWRAEIKRLESRLRVLLGDDAVKAVPA